MIVNAVFTIMAPNEHRIRALNKMPCDNKEDCQSGCQIIYVGGTLVGSP